MKKIFVWGAGEFSCNILECFDMSKVIILGFIDSDKNKLHKKIGGYEVVDVYTAIKSEYDYIFINSVKYQNDIYSNAINVGIPSDKIITSLTTSGQMGKVLGILNDRGLSYINTLQLADMRQREIKIENNINKIQEKIKYYDKYNRNGYLKRYYEMQAAEFIAKNFINSESAPGRGFVFDNRKYYREYIVELLTKKEGLFLEFGVYEGKSINYMSERLAKKTFYGFDSFLGLPEDWHPGMSKGQYDMGGVLPTCNKNVHLIKGWFEDTLPDFLNGNKGNQCAYIHIDCDLYSSAKYVLEQLRYYIGKGTIICFDEFCGFVGWQLDEYKAFNEFIEATGFEYKYIACSYAEIPEGIYISVAVEIL